MGAILSGIGTVASTGASIVSGAASLVGSVASAAVSSIGQVSQAGLSGLKIDGNELSNSVGAFVGAVKIASHAALGFSKNLLPTNLSRLSATPRSTGSTTNNTNNATNNTTSSMLHRVSNSTGSTTNTHSVGGSTFNRIAKTIHGVASGNTQTGALGGIGRFINNSNKISAITDDISKITGSFGKIFSIIGSVVTIPFKIIGTVISVVGKIGSFVLGAIGGIAKLGLGILKTVGGVLAGAVGAFIAALTFSTRAVVNFSKDILSIKASTGMGYGASTRTAMNFGAFGVSSGELSGLLDSVNMIPQFFKARAGAFGLPSYDSKNFIPDLAREFQKLGPIVGRGMLETLGMDTPSIRRLAATSPEKLVAQQQYSTRIQSSLGVKPGDVQNWAEDFSLLMDRVGQFVDLVKYRFASEMLPFLSTALERVTDYLGRNSGKISSLIKSGVSWIFETLPGLIVSTVNTVGHFASSLLRTLANSDSGLNQWVDQFLGIIDIFGNGLISLANIIQSIAKNIHATIGILAGGAIGAIIGAAVGGPVGAVIGAGVGGALGGTVGQAFDDHTKKIKPITAHLDLVGAHKKLINEQGGKEFLNNEADSIDRHVDVFNNTVSSLINETNKKMDAQGKDLKGIRAATEKTAGQGGASSYGATIERFNSYISEDAFALANR